MQALPEGTRCVCVRRRAEQVVWRGGSRATPEGWHGCTWVSCIRALKRKQVERISSERWHFRFIVYPRWPPRHVAHALLATYAHNTPSLLRRVLLTPQQSSILGNKYTDLFPLFTPGHFFSQRKSQLIEEGKAWHISVAQLQFRVIAFPQQPLFRRLQVIYFGHRLKWMTMPHLSPWKPRPGLTDRPTTTKSGEERRRLNWQLLRKETLNYPSDSCVKSTLNFSVWRRKTRFPNFPTD